MFSTEVFVKSEDIEDIEEFVSLNSSEQENQSDFENEEQASSAQVEPSPSAAEFVKSHLQAFLGSLNAMLIDYNEKDKIISALKQESVHLFFAKQDEIEHSEKLEMMSHKQDVILKDLLKKLDVLKEELREYQLKSEASITRIAHLENKAKRLKTIHQEDETIKANLEVKIVNLEKKVADQRIAIKELASELTSSAPLSKTSSLEKVDLSGVRTLADGSPNKKLLLSEAAHRRNNDKTVSSLEPRDLSKENVPSANL